MAATMTWDVADLAYYPAHDGKNNVVFEVPWICSGTEEKDDKTYSSAARGTTMIAYDKDASFTAFDDLTQDQVLGWIWKTDSKADVEANVQASVDEHITPTSLSGAPASW